MLSHPLVDVERSSHHQHTIPHLPYVQHSAIARTSWIVPNILETCVQATNLTFDESRGLRFSGVSLSPSSLDDSHHLTVNLRRSAMINQGFTFVSCSIFDKMISSPSENCRALARFMKSWVVEPPITRFVSISSHCGWRGKEE